MLLQASFFTLTFIKRLFSSSSLSAIRVVSFAYPRLLIFLHVILIAACDSFSSAFHMMYFSYKLKEKGDNIQPCHTPFLILNQSAVPYKVLLLLLNPTYRFLRRQVRWPAIPSFEEFSTVYCDPHSQRLSAVNEAEINVFLEFPCFFYDPVNVGNLISGSSAFSKASIHLEVLVLHNTEA